MPYAKFLQSCSLFIDKFVFIQYWIVLYAYYYVMIFLLILNLNLNKGFYPVTQAMHI